MTSNTLESEGFAKDRNRLKKGQTYVICMYASDVRKTDIMPLCKLSL